MFYGKLPIFFLSRDTKQCLDSSSLKEKLWLFSSETNECYSSGSLFQTPIYFEPSFHSVFGNYEVRKKTVQFSDFWKDLGWIFRPRNKVVLYKVLFISNWHVMMENFSCSCNRFKIADALSTQNAAKNEIYTNKRCSCTSEVADKGAQNGRIEHTTFHFQQICIKMNFSIRTLLEIRVGIEKLCF